MNATQILTIEEVRAAILDGRKRAKKSVNKHENLVIFRLSCCCGLRVKEICGLDLGDLLLTGPRPCLRVRKAITKGRNGKRRSRIVPLWWDKGTLEDLSSWMEVRVGMGATPKDPFVCGLSKRTAGRRLCTDLAAHRWRTALKCLPSERRRQLHIHCGRHSFCSHSLAAGHSLVEVRDAAGHANVATTSIYLHAVGRDDLPDVFAT